MIQMRGNTIFNAVFARKGSSVELLFVTMLNLFTFLTCFSTTVNIAEKRWVHGALWTTILLQNTIKRIRTENHSVLFSSFWLKSIQFTWKITSVHSFVFSGPFSSAEDFDIYIEKEIDHPGYFCSICNLFRKRGRADVRNHVESKHFPGTFTYNCTDCGLVLNTKTSLTRHQQRVHSSNNLLGHLNLN